MPKSKPWRRDLGQSVPRIVTYDATQVKFAAGSDFQSQASGAKEGRGLPAPLEHGAARFCFSSVLKRLTSYHDTRTLFGPRSGPPEFSRAYERTYDGSAVHFRHRRIREWWALLYAVGPRFSKLARLILEIFQESVRSGK